MKLLFPIQSIVIIIFMFTILKIKPNSYKLRVDSLGFSISRIRENIAGNNGEVTIEVTGARIMDSSNVLLRRTGFSDIIALKTASAQCKRYNSSW